MTKNVKDKQQHSDKPDVPRDLVKKEYTDEEKAGIAKYLERAKNQPMKFKKGEAGSGKVTLIPATTDETLGMMKLAEAFGTQGNELQMFLLNQVAQTFRGANTSEGFNYDHAAEFSNKVMALLNGIQPHDEIEGMLAYR